MYDVVVVGSRCAGAPTAMLFARSGYRVLLVDRARFPSDTLSTHYIQPPGVALLARWGLLEPLVATGCPPIERMVYDAGEVRLLGRVPTLDGISASYAPRRYVLDHILIEAAIASGVEFREGSVVTEVLFDEGRASGVRCRTRRGGEDIERARLVVGADGMRSKVAELVGAVMKVKDSLLTCAYYTYWQAVGRDLELYQRPGRAVGVLHTHDGLTLVVCYFPQAEFQKIRQSALPTYLKCIRATAPSLGDRIAGSCPVEPLRGTGDQRNYFRQACGPGWVLVGDAGHHKDSITAHGISDAFEQAALLVECVGASLGDDRALTRALRRFASRRDELLDLRYRITLVAARLEQSAEHLAWLRWLQTDPHWTAVYFAVVAGTAAPTDLQAIREAYADITARRNPRLHAHAAKQKEGLP